MASVAAHKSRDRSRSHDSSGSSGSSAICKNDEDRGSDLDFDAEVSFKLQASPEGKTLSELVEDLKRNGLVKPQPGESKEEAKKKVLADLDDHDRLNACLTTAYSNFDRGDAKLYGWYDVPPATEPTRVVFMFLVVNKLQHEAWWREWFAKADAKGHQDHYCIVYHRGSAYGKDSDTISGDLLADKGIAVWPPTKTGWGRNGLVRATLLLLRFGLEEPGNQWFVLLSDTCMPVYSFHDLYEMLKRQQCSRFRDFGMTLDIAMQRNIWQSGVCTNEKFSHKADQWATWVRADAEWFVRENHMLRLKPLATFVDEQYFINMMDENCRPYQNAATTYTRWWMVSDLPPVGSAAKQNGLKKLVSSPHTFAKVSMNRIRKARRKGCWFMRKVAADAYYPKVEDLELGLEESKRARCSNSLKAFFTVRRDQMARLASSSFELVVRFLVMVLSLFTFGYFGEERRMRRMARHRDE